MKLENLTDKIAVITGASSGIGEAAARLLAAEGMKVVLVARREERIRALAEEIGEAAVAVSADISNGDQVAKVFNQVREQFGALDLLFNNAGMGINGHFVDSRPEDWKTQIDVNLYGVLYCTHAALPLMRGRAGAMVSTVSSVGGRYGIEGWSVYNATKFAVIGLHDALRKELGGEGIRFSVIEPGAVWTEWGHNVPAEAMKKRREMVDALTAEDVANALVYSFAQPPRVMVEEMLIRPVKQLVP
ncbi:SDR family oxidoreductase [Dyella sedimenti]|uniref:SDR family oxidoreductase n=1 Tax=Dyella sedimenti TaxID=2919947 RepID=UPI001FA947A9|nr:SDR family oxidoreductase [Dyella sedimenti]